MNGGYVSSPAWWLGVLVAVVLFGGLVLGPVLLDRAAARRARRRTPGLYPDGSPLTGSELWQWRTIRGAQHKTAAEPERTR